ncbi:rhodanese-like domain-containing protein [Oscillatoria sp. CS-180]|uniref:rhodanese-like domain-containing protein n=1 Tax=Oscillatoria sp. CS-180 TaxID=3021720 RepID=UPI00232ABF21|nr:rhodanese-like domain-containing protein [Oscillatoria sp. CS-180]MDB9527296.1 rhodanese-like domain-containing protein [Oscillatoria sp. CS-180]
MDVYAFADKLKTGSDEIQLIDVREPWELQKAAIAGFINLPLSQFAEWETQIHQHLDVETETIVMCHHGIRSAQMCAWLKQQGFTHVENLVGGIDAYSINVDASVPRY